MKTAFLFPGQGAQHAGMGADLFAASDAAKKIYGQANEILGFDLAKICFEGPAEKLDSTVVSQPAIFTTCAALLETLREKGWNVKPDVTAGLSLGEYTALYAAGVISFADGLKLVQKRGQAMQAAANATKGSMVSILGLDEEKVQALCDQARQDEILEAVNFNCPGQIVVSGSIEACKRAEQLAEKFGAMKAIPLAVAGAFHTSMMNDAALELSKALDQAKIANPSQVSIMANINADFYSSGQEIAEGLLKQLTQPILWQKCMEKLISDGVEVFYEIGPGRVLIGLMKRINRKTKVNNVSGMEAVNELFKS